MLPPASFWERAPWQKDKPPSHSKQATVTHPTAWGTPKGISESLKKDGERGRNSKEIRWNNSLRAPPASAGPQSSHPRPAGRGQAAARGQRGARGRAENSSRGTQLPRPSNLLAQPQRGQDTWEESPSQRVENFPWGLLGLGGSEGVQTGARSGPASHEPGAGPGPCHAGRCWARRSGSRLWCTSCALVGAGGKPCQS